MDEVTLPIVLNELASSNMHSDQNTREGMRSFVDRGIGRTP